jgi:replicative DNA helicase
VLNDVAGDLGPDHFGHRPLGRIYRAAHSLWSKGNTPTRLEIMGACNEEDQRIAEECLSVAATAAGAKGYAAEVRRESDRRMLRSIARRIIDGVEDRSLAPDELAEETATSLHMLTTGHSKDFVTIGDGAADFYADLQRRAGGDGTIGIPTPFPAWDDKIGGFEPSMYYVIGARPSVGKSALAKQIASKAIASGKKVLICNFESSKEAWIRRIVSAGTGVTTMDLKRGRVPDAAWPGITRIVADLEKLGDALTIWDCAGETPAKVRSECMRLQRLQSLDMVIVDYIQKVNPGLRTHSRHDAVSRVSESLCDTGKHLKVPMIVLAQLGRQVQSDDGTMRRPVLTDLKESGSLEQDADMVAFIHREDVLAEPAELLIAKQKDGPLGKVPLRFDKKAVTFYPAGG